jgi:hypothetical protein
MYNKNIDDNINYPKFLCLGCIDKAEKMGLLEWLAWLFRKEIC